MDTTTIAAAVHEFAFVLGSFAVVTAITLWWGRQTIINFTCALYLSLLLFINFPYLERTQAADQPTGTIALITISVFGVFVTLCYLLVARLMPGEYLEGKFESLPKKILLATAATVLVIHICYTVLPINTFLTPQPELLNLFTDDQFEFWWLVLPLVVMTMN